MAKLVKSTTPEDIHLNIEETFKFINENLPEKYARQTLNLLPEDKKVDLAYIRQVKTYKIFNETIINALYRVAQWNKAQKENII